MRVFANFGKNRKSLQRELQMLFCCATLELKQKTLMRKVISGTEKAFDNLN